MFSLGADDCCLGSQLIVRQGPCGAGFFASVLTGVFFWWMWRWRRLLGWWLLALWLFLAFAGEIFAWVCSIANGYTWLLPVAACGWLGAGGALLRFIVSMIGGTGWGFSLFPKPQRGAARAGHSGAVRRVGRLCFSGERRRLRGCLHVWGPRRHKDRRVRWRSVVNCLLAGCAAFAARRAGRRRLRWTRTRCKAARRFSAQVAWWLLRQPVLARPSGLSAVAGGRSAGRLRRPTKHVFVRSYGRRGFARVLYAGSLRNPLPVVLRDRTQGPGKVKKSLRPKMCDERKRRMMQRPGGPQCAHSLGCGGNSTGPSGPRAPSSLEPRPRGSHGCWHGIVGDLGVKTCLLLAGCLCGFGFAELGGAIMDYPPESGFDFECLYGATENISCAFADERPRSPLASLSDAYVVANGFDASAFSFQIGGTSVCDFGAVHERAITCDFYAADRARLGPYQGVRVGEASHPGPAGSRKTARMRKQALQARLAKPITKDDIAKVCRGLFTQFLEQWSASQPPSGGSWNDWHTWPDTHTQDYMRRGGLLMLNGRMLMTVGAPLSLLRLGLDGVMTLVLLPGLPHGMTMPLLIVIARPLLRTGLDGGMILVLFHGLLPGMTLVLMLAIVRVLGSPGGIPLILLGMLVPLKGLVLDVRCRITVLRPSRLLLLVRRFVL